jgi:predicted transport protein
MDKPEQTMLDNLYKNTGKNLDEWIAVVRKQNFEKHGQMVKFLKEQHNFTHGYANLVALKAKGTDAGSVENKDDLIAQQYQGKEHLKPLYDKLIREIRKFGNGVEIAPKKTYVSLRRKKQFAMLQPAAKIRFEIGLNLKGVKSTGKLEAITSANAMCSHRINVAVEKDIDSEVLEWIQKAYEQAG